MRPRTADYHRTRKSLLLAFTGSLFVLALLSCLYTFYAGSLFTLSEPTPLIAKQSGHWIVQAKSYPGISGYNIYASDLDEADRFVEQFGPTSSNDVFQAGLDHMVAMSTGAWSTNVVRMFNGKPTYAIEKIPVPTREQSQVLLLEFGVVLTEGFEGFRVARDKVVVLENGKIPEPRLTR